MARLTRSSKQPPRAGFVRDEGGATAVELALLGIPLIGILVAALQTAVIFFYDQAIQTVANTAARQVMTGSVQSQGLAQGSSTSGFHGVVCTAASGIFPCAGLMVDVQSATSFSNLNTAPIAISYDANGNPTNTFAYTPGVQNAAVIVRVMYDWPVFGGPLGLGLANQANGTRLMVGTAVFKTEPY